MSENVVSLAAFKELMPISDQALVSLLAQNKLPLILNDGMLFIDLSKVSFEQLARDLSLLEGESSLLSTPLVQEEIGAILSQEIETIITRALTALQARRS
jgi:hypothetical protein